MRKPAADKGQRNWLPGLGMVALSIALAIARPRAATTEADIVNQADRGILSTVQGDVFQLDPMPGRYLRIDNCGPVADLRAYGGEEK